MGEILIDFLPITEGGRTVGFTMHPGGSPFNVAVGLARLDVPVAFASKVSSDLFGRFLGDYLRSEGIDDRFALPSDAPSTLAFVAMEDDEPAYAFYDAGAADTLLTSEEMPTVLFEETAILHFGSISLLRGTTPSAVVSTAERLKGKALLSFDPNVRPGLVRDEVAYRALLDRLFSLADLLKISSADLSWLWPGRPPQEAIAHLAAHGPALVVVTQGSKGVLARRGSEDWSVPAFVVEMVDTVGAGDSFSAGLLAGLMDRGVTSRTALEQIASQEIEAALRFAAAASAITCTRPGADTPRRAEVEAMVRET